MSNGSHTSLDRTALLREIEEADRRIRNRYNDYDYVYSTPLRRSARLELRLGCRCIYIKFENLQRGGSFKMRGATNAVARGHEEDPSRVFVAASAGNHGLGLAVASYHYGHQCHIFMPENTPVTKKATIGLYTSNIHMGGENYDATQALAMDFAEAKGYSYIHAFNDPHVIAGQGTIGLELVQQFTESGDPSPDYVLVPVGGGGLISGLGTVLKHHWPSTRIIAVEPELIPSLTASRGHSQPVRVTGAPTLADGVAVAEIGTLTLPIINDVVDEVMCVSENAIATAIVQLIEDARVVVEGAGAIGLAALTKMAASSPESVKDKSFLIITSGGNLDISALSNALQRALALGSRLTHLQFVGRDVPGFLSEITRALAQLKLNIVELSHTRHNQYLDFGWTRVDVMIETEGASHAKWAHDRLRDRGFDVQMVVDG
jgi:threonine dehydratase